MKLKENLLIEYKFTYLPQVKKMRTYQSKKSKTRSTSYLRRILNQAAFENLFIRISKPTHRSNFHRIATQTKTPVIIDEKHYIELKNFKNKLKEFNALSNFHGQYWQCIGHINIRMKLCAQCFSVNQSDSHNSELYFVDKLEKAHQLNKKATIA
nr:uncharacterized protein LOC124807882 isoform X2 [Hydra vulgaris]